MAHETPTITAQPRERTGSRYAQRLRQSGRLPAVVYGHKKDTLSVSVDSIETLTHLHHGTHVINLEIEGVGSETCLVKDLQFGYLGDDVVHVDFARVKLDEIVTVIVRLEFHGQLGGIKEVGAVFVQDHADIEVTCAVRNIPELITVELGDHETSISVGEIEFPPNVTPTAAADVTVAHITIQAEEVIEPVEVEEGEVVADGEAPAPEGEAPASDDSAGESTEAGDS